MKTQSSIKLSDYVPYPFLIPHIRIDFNIGLEKVIVETIMNIEPKLKESSNLVLKGKDIDLVSIFINGSKLEQNEYLISKDNLIIYKTPLTTFKLQIISRINPFKNTSLEGLYLSSGMLTTQCEAEGFRRICYHPDRPDVLSSYLVRIEADYNKYPVLLSNGNKKYSGRLKDNKNRHEIIWEDPFPKPCYLFALVAGKLNQVRDTYTTNSGRLIDIQIYVESGDQKFTDHAINSLKKAMKWDENKFGLEYDLDEYKIVAVRHFNMGAMENKGLNIFNSKLVLADSNTATDDELERIESVIAHEYFHNWSGNRITCRDWFQLSLKEGLTVFRDQSFTADLHSAGLKRIEDVSFLRNFQFVEDDGPTSHAVKPKEYVSIDNFYTTTIYEKGAELIRMLELLLGNERFMNGLKVYFDTLDGNAVTTEDFIECVIKGAFPDHEKCNFSIDNFMNWYYYAGTPEVKIEQSWNSDNSILNISFEQEINLDKSDKDIAMTIPILFSCYNKEDAKIIQKESLFILDQKAKNLNIKLLNMSKDRPVVSFFRRFSSPVKWKSDCSASEYLFLFLNDDDYFTRWNSGQFLMRKILNSRINSNLDSELENNFIEAFKSSIRDLQIKDPYFLATLISIPGLSELENTFDKVNPVSIYKHCLNFKASIGLRIIDDFRLLSQKVLLNINQVWPNGKGQRKLLGTIWSYLALAGDEKVKNDCLGFVDNCSMTLARAALNALNPLKCSETEEASRIFYNRWKNNPVVLDSWFSFEASRSNKDAINVVERLFSHPKFDLMAPNSIRAVLGGFSKNIESFHSSDGQGYMFMAEKLIEIDKINPITASRIVKVFSRWKTYVDKNKNEMYKAILKMNGASISPNTREVIELILM